MKKRASVACLGTFAALLLAPLAPAAAQAAQRRSVDDERLIDALDAATLGLENEFTVPAPTAEATLHGTLSVQYVVPTPKVPQGSTGMFQGEALLRHGRFGATLVPRLRFEDLAAPLSSASVILQQAYVFARYPIGEIKLGKVLAQFGRLWDYSMFGPVLAGYDYKITPDLGASIEGRIDGSGHRAVGYALQYFAVDGRTFSVNNSSLLSLAGVRREHIVTLRVVPEAYFGDLRVALGVSGQTYRARKPSMHQVWRGATDISLTYRRVYEAFAEVGVQGQQDVSSSENRPITPFTYLWAGVQAAGGPLKARSHVNVLHHSGASPGWETLLQPGAEYVASPWLSFVVETGFWWTTQPIAQRTEQNVFVFAVLHD